MADHIRAVVSPPICPNCGLAATRIDIRDEAGNQLGRPTSEEPVGSLRTGSYLCPLDHVWTTRWREDS